MKAFLAEKLEGNDINIADIIIDYKKDMEAYDIHKQKHKKVMDHIKYSVLCVKNALFQYEMEYSCFYKMFTPVLIRYFTFNRNEEKVIFDDWHVYEHLTQEMHHKKFKHQTRKNDIIEAMEL